MSRERISSVYTGRDGLVNVTRLSTGVVTPYRYSFTKEDYLSSTRDDIRVSPIKDGWRTPLPYSAQFKTVGSINLYLDEIARDSANTWETETHLLFSQKREPTLSAVIDVPSSARNRTITQMLNRLNDNKMELGVSLLEARESVSMIGSAARTMQNAMMHASRRNWRGVAKAFGVSPVRDPERNAKDASKAVANGWLSYHFGWSPLVSDVAKAAALLSLQDLADRCFIRTGGKASWSESGQGAPETVVFSYNGDCRVNLIRSYHRKSDYKLSCYYKLDSSYLRGMNQLGLVNIPSVIYQTIPMSFVADWFVSIGDVLGALSATVGLTFVGGSETTFKSVTNQYDIRSVDRVNVVYPVVKYRTLNAFSTPGNETAMVRKVLNSSPLPSGVWIKNPFDPWKTATSCALLRQFASKRK